MAPPHFSIDVTLNRDQKITAAFAGDLFAEHRAACAHVKATAMRAVPAPFDVVLTTNSGYPLDQNLYQAVKGHVGGGADRQDRAASIVCAAECRDGLPVARLVRRGAARRSPNPAALLDDDPDARRLLAARSVAGAGAGADAVEGARCW